MAKKKDTEVEQTAVKLSLKQRALQLKAQLNKGKDDILVQVYNEEETEEQLRVSSGVPKLDRILGGGPNGYGWPRGKLNGIAGPFSSGKSTLTITTIAEFQKIGLCVLVDTENSYDPMYAQRLGVNIDELLIINPTYSEQAFDTVFSLIESNDVRLVVIDTLDYLQPLVVINAESTDQFMGGAAKANNRFIARLIELCRKHDCTAIIVSQIRQKVGFVMGSNEVIGGGTSINYGPHVRIDIRKFEVLKDKSGNEYGQKVKIKTTKNKTSVPQKTIFSNIIWGEGFDKISDIFDIAVDENVIVRGGAWYSYGDLKIQGAENVVEKLRSDEKLLNEIKKKIGM